MKDRKAPAPQKSFFYRLVSFVSTHQLSYFFKNTKNRQALALASVLLSGTSAFLIILAVAYWTQMPLAFPPLAASAFILFRTPMALVAAPRNMIMAHLLAAVIGVLVLSLVDWIYAGEGMALTETMGWPQVWSLALSIGIIFPLLVVIKCEHPPAAATAVLAALGLFGGPFQLFGFTLALILLALEAFLFNRMLGGLPYPLWRGNPKVVRDFGVLAGLPDAGMTFWERFSHEVFRRRK